MRTGEIDPEKQGIYSWIPAENLSDKENTLAI
jgi:hypothetical protein